MCSSLQADAPDAPSPKGRSDEAGPDRADDAASRNSPPGIPLFAASAPACRGAAGVCFNAWAYLLGPLYYLFRGMWRKALSLCLFFCVTVIVPGMACGMWAEADGSGALREILDETYAEPGLVLAVLGVLFPLCVGLGRTVWAGLTAVALAAVFLWGERTCLFLDLGAFSGFVWANAPFVWQALTGAGLFCLLARRFAACLAVAGAALGLWGVGFPFSFLDLPLIPEMLFHLLCGMSAARDLWRHRESGARFWW